MLLMIAACGGGGSEPPTPAPSPSPSPAPTPAPSPTPAPAPSPPPASSPIPAPLSVGEPDGLYAAERPIGGRTLLAVLPNDQLWIFRESAASTDVLASYSLIQADLSTSVVIATTIQKPTAGIVPFGGSVTVRRINETRLDVSDLSPFANSDAVSHLRLAATLYDYTSPASLAEASGSWSMYFDAAFWVPFRLAVSASGSISSTTTYCSGLSGHLEPGNSNTNLFRFQLKTPAGCRDYPLDTVTGTAIVHRLPSGKQQLLLLSEHFVAAGVRD